MMISNSSSSNNLRLYSNSSGNNNSNTSGGVMKLSLKILFVAVLCFIGGMQLDRGFIVQIYFDDNGSDETVIRSLDENENRSFKGNSPSALVENDVDANVAVADGVETTNGIQVVAEEEIKPNDVDAPVVSDDAETANAVDDGVETRSEIQVVVEEEENKPIGDLSKPPEKLVLLGERHGGTNWITDHLAACFGDRIQVTNQYSRFKHWFQEDSLPENSAVVVALFRDPLDWVEAMRFEPHHAHDHVNFPPNFNMTAGSLSDKWWHELGKRMTWKEFVTKPWMGQRGEKDKQILESGIGTENAVCIDGYKWANVAPCSQEDATFLKGLGEYKYEFKFDGSERGFNSILELRRDKVLNHLSVADFRGTRSFFSYRFEDLKIDGTVGLLKNIEKATNLTANCEPMYGMVRDKDGKIKLAKTVGLRRRLHPKIISKKRKLPEDYIRYMNQFVDWEVESKIGYFPRQIE
ncbi:hypothetical protein ACHAWU_007719 [Discostella pseudostelligera]|uniref:Sulfotransferase domain-containing protein n=1 Tax=Discostella pseudostelligera TaxID=259834 RepID=A0ABD3M225_9STRA